MKKLIAIIVLIVAYCSVFGQQGNDTTKYIWYKYQYGQRMPRYMADSVIDGPRDTAFSKYGYARKGNRFFVGDGIKWTETGGGVFDSITIYNLVNSKLSIIDTTGKWQPQHNTLDSLTLQDTTFHSIYSNGTTVDFSIPGLVTSNNIYNLVDTTKDTTFVNSPSYHGGKVLQAADTTGQNHTLTLNFPHNNVALDSIAAFDADGNIIQVLKPTSGGGGTVITVTGNPAGLVDNTDPANPVIQQDASKLNKADSVPGGYYPYSTNPKGYLLTVDTTNIANFYVKVHSLFSATAPITYTNGLIGFATTAVTPGSYTNINGTVDAWGRLTAVSNGSASGSFANTEEKSGSTSSTITLSHTYTSGTIKMWKNGVRMQAADFTEATATTVTLNVARLSYDFFTFDYQY